LRSGFSGVTPAKLHVLQTQKSTGSSDWGWKTARERRETKILKG